jgi:DNA-binding response OmpR family regulator
MVKILIVEDDKAINDLIAMNLKLVGYEYVQAFNGHDAIKVMENEHPHLVLLDVMLPYIDGFSLMERKTFGDIPVIYLTAKVNLSDKIRGLNLGADDYIVKPFETVELLARIEAVLRRTNKAEQEVKIAGTIIYLDEHIVTVNGQPVDLTYREFELLETLVKNRNIALSREKLIELAWGYDYYGDTRTVDVHITKLRKKLHLESHIKTIYKYGYRLEIER